jgi:hypothetical protein
MRLTAAARRRVAKKDFAGTGRTFPIEDKTHAEKALQLAPRSEHAGNITKGQEDSIKAKARAKLGAGEDDPNENPAIDKQEAAKGVAEGSDQDEAIDKKAASSKPGKLSPGQSAAVHMIANTKVFGRGRGA